MTAKAAAPTRTRTPAPAEVVSFGCRLNAFEAEAMRAHAARAGLGDAVIVNSCAVTADAERQARQAIRRARRARAGATIVVTGCAAQIDPASFAAMPEVDHVLGNAEKMDPASFDRLARGDGMARVAVSDAHGPEARAGAARRIADRPVTDFAGRARAFVEVQQGCDHRCTFCIIPYGRGPSRSAPLDAVAAQAARLAAAGYREMVLTGVDLTAYGADLPGRPALGRMVRGLLDRVPELDRLRLSSLDVAEVDDELFRLVTEEPRVMPHLHLSLQAGDDMVLKRMKRRHTRAQAIDFCRAVRAKRPEVAFGADLIAGFPTETDAMFENTLALVADAGLVWLHVFPFSPRPGTPAARMPQVDGAAVKARARLLRETGEAARDRFLAACVGGVEAVLVERPGLGRTPRYAHVALTDTTGTDTTGAGDARTGGARAGDVVRARIVAARDGRLEGVVVG